MVGICCMGVSVGVGVLCWKDVPAKTLYVFTVGLKGVSTKICCRCVGFTRVFEKSICEDSKAYECLERM